MKRQAPLFTLLALLFLLTSCGGGGGSAAVFIGEVDPPEFKIRHKYPESFDFEITEEDGNRFDFALELTYFSEQMQDWEKTPIPLYYILEGGESEADKKFGLTVHDGSDWVGTVLENGYDRRFEETFEKGIELKPGKYKFRLFANTPNEKDLLGIVHLAFKVFKK